jgi:5-methylcytosine-specific restriction endonuclease McrA
VIPRAKGGGDSWLNLVAACKRCNAKKGDYSPDEANMPLRKKPYKPSYAIFLKDHLSSEDDEWDTYLTGSHGH